MKTIFNLFKVKLVIVPTTYFAYHFILKIGNKESSNANTKFAPINENIKSLTGKMISNKIIAKCIYTVLSKKINKYYNIKTT